MKILQICPAFYPAIAIGGPIFTVSALQRAIEVKGHILDVLSTPLGLEASIKESIEYGVQLPIPTPLPIKYSEANIGRITYHRFYGYPHFTFSPQSLRWLLKNVHNYDAVLCHGIWNFPILAAAFACILNRVPYFIFPHGTLYKETVELRSKIKKRIFLTLFVKGILNRAKRVVFTTKDEEVKVSNFLQSKLPSFILPNIVAASDFGNLPMRGQFRARYNIPSDALLLLHYGRITEKKGLEFSIAALEMLKQEFPSIIFAVVGGDENGCRHNIELMARRSGVIDKVIFTGLLNQSDGKRAMIDADVFVLPSLSENFGMAVVEAMLCRLPVVISDNVGIGAEIAAEDAGIVIPLTYDNKPLVEALSSLLRSRETRRTLGEKGRIFAIKHYDVNAVSSRIDELLGLV